MLGKKSQLTALALRKQLLLAESELNRKQLIREVEEWKDEFHRSKERLENLGSVASMTAKVAATVATASRVFSGSNGGKRSWIASLFNSATTGTSLWFLFRSFRRKARE